MITPISATAQKEEPQAWGGREVCADRERLPAAGAPSVPCMMCRYQQVNRRTQNARQQPTHRHAGAARKREVALARLARAAVGVEEGAVRVVDVALLQRGAWAGSGWAGDGGCRAPGRGVHDANERHQKSHTRRAMRCTCRDACAHVQQCNASRPRHARGAAAAARTAHTPVSATQYFSS